MQVAPIPYFFSGFFFALVLSTQASAQAFPYSDLLENGAVYSISSRNSGKCLDVKDHSLLSGGRLQQWDCHGGDNQKFIATVTYKSGWILTPVESGIRLIIAGNSLDNGAKLVQEDYAEGNNGFFFVRPDAQAGSFIITANHSGKCLDVTKVSRRNGASIQQWDCHGGLNQSWAITKVD